MCRETFLHITLIIRHQALLKIHIVAKKMWISCKNAL